MIYAPWSDQDRFGSDRFGSYRFGSDRFGPDLGSDLGSDRFGSDQFGPDRFGSVRTDSLLYALLSISLLTPYPGIIPSIPDYPKYRIIISVP